MATWRDRVKSQAKAPQEKPVMRGNSTRTKDDEYKAPPKTIPQAVEKWKERKAPPLLPISPGVGPTQDAKRIAAVKYKMTPEAAADFRQTPVALKIPDGGERAGGYDPSTRTIDAMVQPGQELTQAPETLAHEYGHKFWDTRLTDQEKASYIPNHNRWAEEGGPYSPGALATGQFNRDQAATNLYQNDAASRPTETHARVMEMAPVLNGQDIPGYMQPYYRGLLRDVPNPRPVQNPNPVQRQGADANGLMGRPAQQWRNYW